MASTETIPGFRDRLALYGIDDRTRSLLAEAWPAIAPGLERAIHEILQPNLNSKTGRCECKYLI